MDAAKQRQVSLSKLLEEAVTIALQADPGEVFPTEKPTSLGPPKASVELTQGVRARARRFSSKGGTFQDIAVYGLRRLLAEKNRKPTAMAS